MSAQAYMIAASELNKRKKPILIGVAVVGGGGIGYFLYRRAMKNKYLEMAATGEVNVIAAQRAYDLLPVSIKESTFLARMFVSKSAFRGANEIQEFFRSESFKSSYFKVVTTVTNDPLFRDSFRGLYGFDLYKVLGLFMTNDEVIAIRKETEREKVRANTNTANQGSYIVSSTELGLDDIMYFLNEPIGWGTGYAWIGNKIPKNVYLGLHSGTEVYKVKNGKETRKGHKFIHLQQYKSGGKTYTAKSTFLVDSSKVKLEVAKPTATRFNFWNYYDQTKYVADYLMKIKAMVELYKKRKALGGFIDVYEKAMNKITSTFKK